MKRLLLLLLLPPTVIALHSASAADEPRSVRPTGESFAGEPVRWHWLNPRPTDQDLEDIVYASPSTAFAVGEGTIIRSTDGGYTWENLLCPTREVLRAVSFADEATGAAVGHNGTILYTTDGGDSWTAQTSGTNLKLMGVSLTDPLTGTAVGEVGTILRTTDGGVTWIPQASGTARTLRDVDFVNALTGVAVGDYETILRTDDGGATWTPQPLEDDQRSYGLYSVDLIDSLTCWASGVYGTDAPFPWDSPWGGLIRTTDAGATWTHAASAPHQAFYLSSVHFGDSLVGATVGNIYDAPGYFMGNTFDGGATWRFIETGPMDAVAFGDGSTSCTVGAQGFIYHTTDGWRNGWDSMELRKESPLGTDADFRDVCFTGDRTGVVVGQAGAIWRTTDGGRSWEHRSFTPAGTLRDVDFVGSRYGWAAGEGGVMLTIDGGDGWHHVAVDVDRINAVSFVDSANGWAAGDDGAGVILRTTDGGANWSELYRGSESVNDVCFANRRRGWAVTDDYVLRTFDGGENWGSTFPVPGGFNAVAFTDTASGAIVGYNGLIRWTTDGGDTWTPQTSGVPAHLWDVALFDDSVAVATGDDGTILVTTDAGATWERQYTSTAKLLYGADATGRVVGEQGLVLSAVAIDVADPPPPPPPSPQIASFSADPDFDHVYLDWQVDHPDSVVGFGLLRQSVGAGDVLFPAADSLLELTINWYDDHAVDPGSTYTYSLIVPLTSGRELHSDPLTVTIPLLPAIAEFRAAPEIRRVELFWQVDPLDYIHGYRLIRSQPGADDVVIPATTFFRPSARNHVDQDLEPGTEYTYTLVVQLTSSASGGQVRSDPLVVTTVAVPAFTAFEATPGIDNVRLDWDIDTTDNVRGFRLLRELEGLYFDAWIPDDSLLAPTARSFEDAGVEPASDYGYTVVAFLESGGDVRTQTVLVTTGTDASVPRDYALGQNYPNPFNPDTEIPYALPEAARVTVEVFDTKGRRVRVLVDENQEAGHKSAPWDGLSDAGNRVASGIYFYRLSAGGYTETRKMVLLR